MIHMHAVYFNFNPYIQNVLDTIKKRDKWGPNDGSQ